MFTAKDIKETTFETVRKGYNIEDVDSFLDSISKDFDSLLTDKTDLEEKLYVLAEKIERYQKDEETIKATLINAQKLGESIIADAESKADEILTEAIKRKNEILAPAHIELDELNAEKERLEKEVSDFKRTVLSLYKSHIESLSTLPEKEEPQEENEEHTETAEDENLTAEDLKAAEEQGNDTTDKYKDISSLFGF